MVAASALPDALVPHCLACKSLRAQSSASQVVVRAFTNLQSHSGAWTGLVMAVPIGCVAVVSGAAPSPWPLVEACAGTLVGRVAVGVSIVDRWRRVANVVVETLLVVYGIVGGGRLVIVRCRLVLVGSAVCNCMGRAPALG